jgi:hypothetical protein
VGDLVYLKLQPFRFTAFNIHQHLKLTTRYYGPFKILEKIGPTAYKLQLPENVNIHPVFYVSQLKKHIGPKDMPQSNLPMVTPEGYIKVAPVVVLDTRALPRGDEIITQWQVQWENLQLEQATWEDKMFIKSSFLEFDNKIIHEWWSNEVPCGQGSSQEGGLSGPKADQE